MIEDELYKGIPEEVIPIFCTKCGNKFIRVSETGLIWVMPVGEPYEKIHFKLTGFDVYCAECEWSGDISPDVPEDIIIRKEE